MGKEERHNTEEGIQNAKWARGEDQRNERGEEAADKREEVNGVWEGGNGRGRGGPQLVRVWGDGRDLATRVAGHNCTTPQENGADLPEFALSRANLLLWEVYLDHPNHKNGLQLDGGVADDAVWQRHWYQMATKSVIWYTTPQGSVGHHFMEFLVEE